MDNKCYHRGSGEVVRLNWDKPVRNKFSQSEVEMQMWEEELQQHISEWNDHVLSRPVIGSIDPSYPVGWVGDDVEMVWQVRIRKSMEWFNTEKEIYDKWLKEIYDKWLTDGAKEDLRRILFLPVNKVTVKSESHAGEKKPFIVANVRDILDYWNNGEGCTFSRMVEMFNEVADKFYNKKQNP